jgi:aarF domain-containing kinase
MRVPSFFPLLLLLCCWVGSTQAFIPAMFSASPNPRGCVVELSATVVEVPSRLGARSSEEDDVTFPPPLTTVGSLQRAATFWLSVLPIVADYYGLISRIKLKELLSNEGLSEKQIEELWAIQHEKGAAKLAQTITELKGFYVKTAQIISTRQDLFPSQYTEALLEFTDNVDPMPASLARAVIQSELLHPGEAFEDVFSEFDDVPLGAASVAQVHKAVLTEKYGGKTVAVKVQRPSIESKLLGDVANLIAITKTFRDNPNLPLDYYTVFVELEKQLKDEFDFVAEAAAMERISTALARAPDGTPREVPVVIPRPVPGLISRRVLVMDYLEGVPLSRAQEEMKRKGIDPESPQAKLFGRQLLSVLTQSFGRSILETGFFHAEYVLLFAL